MSTLAAVPDADLDDVEIQIGLPLPLTVAGYLLEAIGQAYPGTSVKTGGPRGSMVLTVPKADVYAFDDRADLDLAEEDRDPLVDLDTVAAARMADPETTVFLTSIRDGLGCSLPTWLSTLLVTLSDSILAVSEAANYLELAAEGPSEVGMFHWIVCRPGRPSPHDLRRRAEEKVDRVQALCAAATDGTVSVADLLTALEGADT